MIRAISFVVFCAVAAPTACHAQSRPGATDVRIVCTVATPGKPQLCSVEFGQPVAGPSVVMGNREEAEELVAILLSNPGAVYVFDDGLSAAGEGGPAGRKQRERLDVVGAR